MKTNSAKKNNIYFNSVQNKISKPVKQRSDETVLKKVLHKCQTLESALKLFQQKIVAHVFPTEKPKKPVVWHAVFDIDDTLIFDMNDNKGIQNQHVIKLLYFALALNIQVHLVTARLENPEILDYTKKQLKMHGISNDYVTMYASLSLAPEKARESMTTISEWKFSRRNRHNAESNGHTHAALFSVGDQWGDGLVLVHDDSIKQLDTQFKTEKNPFLITKGHGTKLFLKLPADDK